MNLRTLLGSNVAPEFIEACECGACEGAGRIAVGDFGSHYRDGEQYDAPGEEVCEACDGTGMQRDYRDDQKEREEAQFERYCAAHPDHLEKAL